MSEPLDIFRIEEILPKVIRHKFPNDSKLIQNHFDIDYKTRNVGGFNKSDIVISYNIKQVVTLDPEVIMDARNKPALIQSFILNSFEKLIYEIKRQMLLTVKKRFQLKQFYASYKSTGQMDIKFVEDVTVDEGVIIIHPETLNELRRSSLYGEQILEIKNGEDQK